MYRESGEEDRSVLVVAFNGHVYGVDPATGERIWRHSVGGGIIEIAVTAGRVLACDGNVLTVISYPDGRVLGRTRLPSSFAARASVLVENDRVLIGLNGEVMCCNLDGQLLWHEGFTGEGLGSVALAFPDNRRPADDAGSG